MKDYICRNNKYILISLILIIFTWGILGENYDDIIIPSISSTIKALNEIIGNGNFLMILFSSLKRFLIAFIITMILSVIMSILSRINNFIYNLMIPIVALLKSVPTMGIVIIALIWLNNDKAPILIGFIIVFPILYEGFIGALKSIDKKLIEMARMYKVSKKNIIKDIYIPSMIHGILPLMPSAMGLMLKVIIAGEVLGQPAYSIGGSMNLEKIYLNTPGVFAWIIIVMIITSIFDFIIKLMVRRSMQWKA